MSPSNKYSTPVRVPEKLVHFVNPCPVPFQEEKRRPVRRTPIEALQPRRQAPNTNGAGSSGSPRKMTDFRINIELESEDKTPTEKQIQAAQRLFGNDAVISGIAAGENTPLNNEPEVQEVLKKSYPDRIERNTADNSSTRNLNGDTASISDSPESEATNNSAVDIYTTNPKHTAIDIEPETPETQDKDYFGRPSSQPGNQMQLGPADSMWREESSIDKTKQSLGKGTKCAIGGAAVLVIAAATATGLGVYFSRRKGNNNSIDLPTPASPTTMPTTTMVLTTTAHTTETSSTLATLLPPELMPHVSPEVSADAPEATQGWQNEPIVVTLQEAEPTPQPTPEPSPQVMQSWQNEPTAEPRPGVDPAPRKTPTPNPTPTSTAPAKPHDDGFVPFESPGDALGAATLPEPSNEPCH
jgi:hypothetical protein